MENEYDAEPELVLVSGYQLHHVSHRGDIQALQVLLTSGRFNINEGNYDMNRPLHEACLAGHYDCAVLLCSYGANVNLRNIDGATPLCDACSKGSLECINLLLEKGALVNLPFLLITPLHETVLGDNWQCIAPLLQHGASLEASDLDYGTPLQTAVGKGFLRCASILLKAGALVNVCKNHQTSLHTAARAGDYNMVCLLLEYGANVYLRDARGRRAIQLVPVDISQNVKELLKKYEETGTNFGSMSLKALKDLLYYEGDSRCPSIIAPIISTENSEDCRSYQIEFIELFKTA